VINRKDIREAFTTLLRQYATSASEVLDYQPGKLDTSPVACVSSGGSNRPPLTFSGNQTTVYLDIDVFVLAAHPDDVTYTQAEAEDMLDHVEHEIADMVSQHQETLIWNTLDYADRSQTDFVVLDGKEYKRERISIAVGTFR
jgi:hypothetical protein